MPLILALLLALVAAAQAARADEPARLSLYVFDHGRPAAGVAVHLDGAPWANTSVAGAVVATVPPGHHRLDLYRGDAPLTAIDLDLGAGDDAQLIVSIDAGGVHVDREQARAPTATAPAHEATAATGIVQGTLRSAEDGRPVAGAQIFLSGERVHAESDAQGRYRLRAAAGPHTLSVIHPRFASASREVTVPADGTATLDLELTPAGVELEDYVVLAPYIQGSVASVVGAMRDSDAVLDVLGAEQMARAGDANAAGALRRVTGLTIEGGRYVVIRGQPARYTLTLLNGSPLPSPDPIRRVVPLDLFPTHVLAGVSVQKTYSPDRPGDFAGGLVDLSLRGVPEAPFARVKVSGGYNGQSTGKDGLDYAGGGRDWLGVDDGTRAVPRPVVQASDGGTVNLNGLPADQRAELGRSFPDRYAVTAARHPFDQGLSASGGGRLESRWGRFGALAGVSWKRKYRYREETDRDLYLTGPTDVAILNDFTKRRSDTRVNLGGILVLGGEWTDHRLTLDNLFIRDTDKRAQISEGLDRTSDDRYERNYLLDWNQRQMRVHQLRGEHRWSRLQARWRWLTARGRRDAPDRRTYTYQRQPDGTFVLYEESGVQRLYNQVDDRVGNQGLDLTWTLRDDDRLTAFLRTGLAHARQDRLSDTARFRFEPSGAGLDLAAPVEDILAPEHIGQGIDFIDDTQSNDDYRARARVAGQYLMGEVNLKERLRLVGGARLEQADYRVETFARSSQGRSVIAGGFQSDDLLPALAATIHLGETQQLRAAYSTTLARPELVELSATLFFDPDTGEAYVGNPDLKPAAIGNYDLRWEWYPSTQESLNVGVFLRDYTDPIERAFVPVAGGGQRITFQNADGAVVYGLEAGTRLDLARWGREGWALQANLTLMDSRVRLAPASLATSTDRPLQGQADHLLNLQLLYDGERIDGALNLNRVGRRLDKAGVQGLPDIYRQPVTDLSATMSWRPRPRLKVGLKAANLLDSPHRYVGAGITERAWRTGRSLALSLAWKLP